MAHNAHDLLIIYTSKNGRTGAMVEPIRQGIEEAGASTLVRTVDEVRWEEMLSAKAATARRFKRGLIFRTTLKQQPGLMRSC